MPTYTVQPGDSFFSIAGKLYGNQRYAQQLVEMNGAISLHPGMSINVPDSGSLPTTPVLTYDVWNALTGSAPTTTTSTTPVVVGSSGSPQQAQATGTFPTGTFSQIPTNLSRPQSKFSPKIPIKKPPTPVPQENVSTLPANQPTGAGTGFALSNLDNIANPPSAGTGVPLSMLDQLSPNVPKVGQTRIDRLMEKKRADAKKKKTPAQAQQPTQPTPPQQVPLSSLDSVGLDKYDEVIGVLQAYVAGQQMGVGSAKPPEFITGAGAYEIARKLGVKVEHAGQMMLGLGYKQNSMGNWLFVGLPKKVQPTIVPQSSGWGGSVQYDDGGGGGETPDLFRVAQGSLAFRVATG